MDNQAMEAYRQELEESFKFLQHPYKALQYWKPMVAKQKMKP
jgi:hypothetical protein